VPPVVDGRHIYAVVGRTAGDTHVLAIDPANGRTIWELEVESVVDHPPTVAGALLYIGTRAGRLMAIDSSTGEVRWSRDWTSAVAGPALVRDGVLYAGASEVFALDAATGKRRWRHGVGSAVAWPLAMDRGVVAVLAADSHFYLISAKNGKQRLSFPLWFTPSGGPAIGDRAVAFAGTRGRVQAMDLEATDIPFEKMIRWWRTKAYLWDVVRTPPPVPRGYLWQQRGLGGIGARALGGDDRATYYAVDDLDGGGRLVALADADGRVLWQANVETRLGSSATFAGSLVLVGAASGRVHAIDVGSGEELWTLDVGTPLAASPAVVGDLLIVAAADGYLGAFRLAP
jgi:outer membrane protein assembly factor BamB